MPEFCRAHRSGSCRGHAWIDGCCIGGRWVDVCMRTERFALRSYTVCLDHPDALFSLTTQRSSGASTSDLSHKSFWRLAVAMD